ncbi:uncharacterized protein E0L32_000545 [Thyridium curvatum]|uniref:RING-type domain-containing protein n=1 Tax=Thyridium curvatum TaxID=1093900 RepID=A0A507BAP2_9PEZI|nr:uncharacterized protein E0L32_000545 [Thyridium curvatum]TPX14151.1 hypothetical protein E0L32_000545 [Thyridium curvatum]
MGNVASSKIKTVRRFHRRGHQGLTRLQESGAGARSASNIPEESKLGSPADQANMDTIDPRDLIWVSDDDTPPSTPESKTEPESTASGPALDDRDACFQSVQRLFPDICDDYLRKTSQDKGHEHDAVIAHILDSIDNGEDYPRRPRKRKRSEEDDDVDADDEVTIATKKFNHPGRQIEIHDFTRIRFTKTLLVQNFPRIPCKDLYALLDIHNCLLFPTVLAIGKIVDEWNEAEPPFQYKRRPTREEPLYSMNNLPQAIKDAENAMERELLEEFRAAKIVLQAQRQQRAAERQQELEEQANFERAKAAGQIRECGCCFGDAAENRMVHCNGDYSGGDRHWFCRDCARRAAETEIGLSKYHLACLSMDGCPAGFSPAQRELFLDTGMQTALERIEQEALLRMAGIENLETCPFCPYAAEYPSVEVNKEFRCDRADCGIVSCRLCRKETHIPKTCAEMELDKEDGESARRTIEEAMTAALVRNCNKCGTPFIKEDGCNKMTCTRSGCRNVQCYVCHKSCDYSHFDDSTRGGKKGNCPLFENVAERHEREVREAEERTRQEVVDANPGVALENLQINVSERVKEDEKKRKARDPRHVVHIPVPARARHLGHNIAMGRHANEAVAAVGVPPREPYEPLFGPVGMNAMPFVPPVALPRAPELGRVADAIRNITRGHDVLPRYVPPRPPAPPAPPAPAAKPPSKDSPERVGEGPLSHIRGIIRQGQMVANQSLANLGGLLPPSREDREFRDKVRTSLARYREGQMRFAFEDEYPDSPAQPGRRVEDPRPPRPPREAPAPQRGPPPPRGPAPPREAPRLRHANQQPPDNNMPARISRFRHQAPPPPAGPVPAQNNPPQAGGGAAPRAQHRQSARSSFEGQAPPRQPFFVAIPARSMFRREHFGHQGGQ